MKNKQRGNVYAQLLGVLVFITMLIAIPVGYVLNIIKMLGWTSALKSRLS